MTNTGRLSHDASVDCIVIGAGPSGLVTMKELIEQGLSVLTLEAQSGLGGVYRNTYDFMRMVTSNNHISFGSYPHGAESEPIIWDRHGYIDYLQGFASHFSLIPQICFCSQVIDVRREEDSTFIVITEDGRTFSSNYLAVCSGVNEAPRHLSLEGADEFEGEIIHSSDVRNGQVFEGRHVLIAGLGESASDIALEVAKYAESTCISSRGGPGFVIPRHFAGTVTDLDTNRCYHSLPYQIFDRWPVKFKVWLEQFYANDSDDPGVLKRTKEFNQADGRPWKMRTSTKSTSFIEAILNHNTQYKCGIDHLEKDRAVFEDYSDYFCDTIIDCTGYRFVFPFLQNLPELIEKSAKNPRTMYKHMIVPEIGEEISFIGFIRPAVGAIPPCAEMQARFLALLLSSKKCIPSLHEMQQDIWLNSQKDQEQFSYHFNHVLALTDYLRFLDGMAHQIGCMPPVKKLLFSDIRLWAKLMFATLTGIHYRLNGPGEDYQAARQVLLKMPTMPIPILSIEMLIKIACESYAWARRALCRKHS